MSLTRVLYTFSFFFFFASVAQSQIFCDTEMPEAYAEEFYSKDMSYLQGPKKDGPILEVPVHYHIIGEDNGTGYHPLSAVIDGHCTLNKNFAGSDIQFYIDGISYIDNSSFYQFTGINAGNQAMNQNNISGVCNIYINDDPRGVCGYAYFPGSGPSGGGIFLKKSCHEPGATTLTHEMGHYMGMPHTFSTNGGVEFVNGSNCASTGDRFCDTPADFLDYRWACPYTGTETDPNGDPYAGTIDEEFFMSYSQDACQNKFSPMQETEMYNVCQNQRGDLLNGTVPNMSLLDTVEILYPPNNSSGYAYNSVLLKWRSVPGAEFYNVTVTRFLNASFYNYNEMVTDTSVVIALEPNKNFRWRVKPWNLGNTCTDFTVENRFTTSSATADIIVSEPTCIGDADGELEININGLSGPFSYSWSSGSSVTNTLSGLKTGDYSVTADDGNGNIVIASAVMTEAEAMDVIMNINQASRSIISNTTGGRKPYSFNWSNGVTDSVIANLTPGTYEVTVTDANGCTFQKSALFNYATSIDQLTNEVDLKLFPNPLSNSNELNLSFNSGASGIAELLVYDIRSSEVFRERLEIAAGSNRKSINMSVLESGIYMVQLNLNGVRFTSRLSIVK